jgi:hypothetical protein
MRMRVEHRDDRAEPVAGGGTGCACDCDEEEGQHVGSLVVGAISRGRRFGASSIARAVRV